MPQCVNLLLELLQFLCDFLYFVLVMLLFDQLFLLLLGFWFTLSGTLSSWLFRCIAFEFAFIQRGSEF